MPILISREKVWIYLCGDGHFGYMNKIGKYVAIMFHNDNLLFQSDNSDLNLKRLHVTCMPLVGVWENREF